MGKSKISSTKEDLDAVHAAIQQAEEYNLVEEVITTAMRWLKENPSLSIKMACYLGINEWIK